MADEKPNWWATLPGLMTAAAAVITAVTGLILGLGQLGLLDGLRPAAGTSTGSPSGPAEREPSPLTTTPGERTPAAANGNWSVTLPAERKYRSADVEYELLDAGARPDVTGKIALTVSVRCTNHGTYDINFWDANFRLNAGGVSIAPDSGLDEVVAGDSSKTGTVRFVLPSEVRDPVLRIKFVQGESLAPLVVAPA